MNRIWRRVYIWKGACNRIGAVTVIEITIYITSDYLFITHNRNYGFFCKSPYVSAILQKYQTISTLCCKTNSTVSDTFLLHLTKQLLQAEYGTKNCQN